LVVQNGPSVAASALSVPGVRQNPDNNDVNDEGCKIEQPDKSYVKKPLPPVKSSTVSGAFKWHRSQSVDNISFLKDGDKPVVEPKPKTTPNNKGILH